MVLALGPQRFALAQGGGELPYYNGYAPRRAVAATRGIQPDTRLSVSAKYVMASSSHYARGDLSDIQLTWSNWFIASYSETGTGTGYSMKASIEYPSGVFTPVTFAGLATSAVVTTAFLTCDTVSGLVIPDGALFKVRSYGVFSQGVPYLSAKRYAASGDALQTGISQMADLTMGGDITDGGLGLFGPIKITATTKRPAFLLLGNSRNYGQADVLDDTLDQGELARTVGQYYGYINCGKQGDRGFSFVATHTNRVALATAADSGITHVISEYGINDINSVNLRTSDQLKADWLTIAGYYSPLPFYQTTMPPNGGTGNTVGPTNSVRVECNDWLRDGAPTVGGVAAAIGTVGALRIGETGHPFAGYFEVADVVESARNSGIWKTPGYSTDWTHETRLANLAIMDAKVIAPSYP